MRFPMIEQPSFPAFEERIGYHFHDASLLQEALTHSSYANEHQGKDYERLEFLGDAVLEMVSSAYLFERYPSLREGELSKERAALVCENALAFCAKELRISEEMFLGRGEEAGGGRKRASIIADMMEAVIGAIYLDGGIEAARNHSERFILTKPKSDDQFHDYKSALQELVQEKQGVSLHYELCKEEGPEHEKVFTTAVCLNGRKIGEGEGRSKKESEQRAAYQAVTAIQNGTVCI